MTCIHGKKIDTAVKFKLFNGLWDWVEKVTYIQPTSKKKFDHQ